MAEARKIRVLVAKPGLDGHDRGAKVVARHLRDAGFEVIYLGLRQTPEKIAAVADQEDVNVVGLSVLSGAHVPLAAKVMRAMKARGLDSVRLVMGGTIPKDDEGALKEAGVHAVFPTGSDLAAIAEYIGKIKK